MTTKQYTVWLVVGGVAIAGIIVLGGMAVVGVVGRQYESSTTEFTSIASVGQGEMVRVSVPVESSMGGSSLELDRIVRHLVSDWAGPDVSVLPSRWELHPVDRATREWAKVARELIVPLVPGSDLSNSERNKCEQAVADAVVAYADSVLEKHVLFQADIEDSRDAIRATLTLPSGQRWPGKVVPVGWVMQRGRQEGLEYAILQCRLESRRTDYEPRNVEEVHMSKKGLIEWQDQELKRVYIITINDFPIRGGWARSVSIPAEVTGGV
jgi:hypothetical protein